MYHQCIYEDKWGWWSKFIETATVSLWCCLEGKTWKTRLEFIIVHCFSFLTPNGSFSLGSINQSKSINQGLNNSITLKKKYCFSSDLITFSTKNYEAKKTLKTKTKDQSYIIISKCIRVQRKSRPIVRDRERSVCQHLSCESFFPGFEFLICVWNLGCLNFARIFICGPLMKWQFF